MRVVGDIVLPVVVVALCVWGEQQCATRFLGLPSWLQSGNWQWLVAVALLMAFSRWRFGTIMPGVLGGLAGTLAIVGWSFLPSPIETLGLGIDMRIVDAGLLMPLFGGLPAVWVLYVCERQIARRNGEQPSRHWLAIALASVAIVIVFSGIWRFRGRFPGSDAERWAVFGDALLIQMALLFQYAVTWPFIVIARSLFPATGRWPADGATVLNSLCGYSTFAVSCLTLPLFLPLAWIMPGGRQWWIAAAMRRAMRWVFWMTPTVTWRMAGGAAALEGARVVVSNHEGMLDILVACALPGTRTLLAKTWVFRAFPLGVAARTAGLKNSDLLVPDDYLEGQETSPVLAAGLGLFVFPEGKRSRSGAIDRFRPGAFVLAKSLDAAVVPVAIAGSRQGIRPGSMWIHPTRLISHVLPPMRPEGDESMRQFAARVRAAISTQRLLMMRELVLHPRFTRSHRQFFTGLPPGLRKAAYADHRAGPWRLLTAVVRDVPGTWVMLGCGWSAIPVALRQLLPAMPIHAVEPYDQRRGVALHAWLNPGDDALIATCDELVGDGPLAGIACLLDEAGSAGMAARLVPRCRDGVVLVRRAVAGSWRAAFAAPGDVRELAGDAEWVVLAAG